MRIYIYICLTEARAKGVFFRRRRHLSTDSGRVAAKQRMALRYVSCLRSP